MTNERNNREKDTFKDGIFSWQEWSAPRLIFADDIRETIGRFALVGRRIKQMQILGTCYTYLGYVVEERAEVVLAHLDKEKCERMSRYMNIDHEMRFPRWAQIDRPFMIAFDDGDVFEIDIPWEMEFRMSMNCIPWDTNPSGEYNLDADVLFSNCLGQRIVAVELGTEMRDAHPVTGEPFIKLPFSRECVEHIILRLENGVALKLYGFADYCEVKCIDAHDEMLDIRFGDLKKGLYNWEDYHADEVTGFEADSNTVFFNEKGRENAQGECITLFADSCPASNLYISHWNFLLLDWCISLAVGGWFDECGAYHFTTEEWRDILDEADRILAVETYEAMCEMLLAKQGAHDYMTKKLTCGGEGLWRDKKKYKTQIDDVRKWSELVLCDDGIMHVCGY